jgi:phosphatidylserine/phosphatidylglycerophosphate/cardiolipin synthase-like enzyme
MSPYKTMSHDLTFTAYAGDGAVLLAFDLEQDKALGLAGFAVKAATPARGPYPTNEYWLKNRLSLKKSLTNETTLTPEKWVESNKAPFQTFHWVHFPGAGPGQYTYTVYPCYFKNGGSLEMDPGTSLNVDLDYRETPGTDIGFTRGAISSQAYADRFKNADIRPKEKTVDFDTSPYRQQYEWLGAHARELIFDFLDECARDRSATLDVFSYDLDEPDIIRKIASMGPRARVVQDDSALHVKGAAVEPDAVEIFKKSGVAVRTGHFRRYSHDKVLIKKESGKAVKVLTGSTNFSIRGMYIQANSVALFDNPQVAGLYEQAFEQAFNDMGNFRSSEIASQWFDLSEGFAAPLSVSFAPHETSFTLKDVSDAIERANSSVFFAVMQTTGKGPVMPALVNLADRKGLFSLGILDTKSDLKLFKEGASNGVTSKSWLRKNAPKPFLPELSGLGTGAGFAGHVIHHKFVVCDFNDASPVVFCGSSNLAEGGETFNGDNLIAIHDPAVVYSYAVEAIRLYDHYRFRSLHEGSTANQPLMLDATDRWTEPFYNPDDIKFHERRLYSKTKAAGFAPGIEARA